MPGSGPGRPAPTPLPRADAHYRANRPPCTQVALFLAKAEGRLAKWRLRLAEFDFEVLFRPGVKQSVPDAFSRVETTNGDQGALEDEIPYFAVEDPRSYGWDFADGGVETSTSLPATSVRSGL